MQIYVSRQYVIIILLLFKEVTLWYKTETLS